MKQDDRIRSSKSTSLKFALSSSFFIWDEFPHFFVYLLYEFLIISELHNLATGPHGSLCNESRSFVRAILDSPAIWAPDYVFIRAPCFVVQKRTRNHICFSD